MENAIIYWDAHDDYRTAYHDSPNNKNAPDLHHGWVYPKARKNQVCIYDNGDEIEVPGLQTEIRSNLTTRTIRSNQLEEVLRLIGLDDETILQCHIDPDISGLHKPSIDQYMIHPLLTYQATDDDISGIDLEKILATIKGLKPHFLGVFEWYLSEYIAGPKKLPKYSQLQEIEEWPSLDKRIQQIRESIQKLLAETIGAPETILAPTIIAPHLEGLAQQVQPYQVQKHSPGFIFENGHPINVALKTPEGQIIDTRKLMRRGQLFGIFDEHTAALAFLDYGPTQST